MLLIELANNDETITVEQKQVFHLQVGQDYIESIIDENGKSLLLFQIT
nr:hypothetical protein [Mucilaginibacter sp. X4EP1]